MSKQSVSLSFYSQDSQYGGNKKLIASYAVTPSLVDSMTN